jgi:hypothetical protein
MKEYKLEDLIAAWKAGERGYNLYKNSIGEKMILRNDGIYHELSNNAEIVRIPLLFDYNLRDTYTKTESIIETDLIGALQLHKDGKANRFRIKGDIGYQWEDNPIRAIKSSISQHWQQVTIECKKEDSDHE